MLYICFFPQDHKPANETHFHHPHIPTEATVTIYRQSGSKNRAHHLIYTVSSVPLILYSIYTCAKQLNTVSQKERGV